MSFEGPDPPRSKPSEPKNQPPDKEVTIGPFPSSLWGSASEKTATTANREGVDAATAAAAAADLQLLLRVPRRPVAKPQSKPLPFNQIRVWALLPLPT